MARLIAARPEPITLLATSRNGTPIPDHTLGHPASKIVYPRLDVTSAKDIQALANEIKENFGKVDVLINNAGVQLEESNNSTFGPEIIRKTFAISKTSPLVHMASN